ncbi:MAG: fibronectin type III domain-containing protein [Putridiphycobacter sp.]|nr:fibronectin type III domain-containing protein [Putridiphycobacter sp.]
MKKITLRLFAFVFLVFTIQSYAQFGCDSAIAIADGYTSSGITTLGDGSQDWNNNPPNSCVYGVYFDSDVYMFEYTSTGFEELSITIYNRVANVAAGFYTTCSGMDFGDCVGGAALAADASTTFVSSTLSPGQTVYIAVGAYSGGLDFDVTDFTVSTISCPNPSNLEVLSVTPTSAILSWDPGNTETAWEYVVQAPGMGEPTGSGTASSAPATEAMGLNAGTYYEFYVRANCGSSDFSAWVGPYAFATQCNVVTDFFEDFEATTGTDLPICWAKVGTLGTVNGTNDFANGFGSTRCLFLGSASASERGVASMQTISNANDGTHQIRLQYRAAVASQIGQTMELGYLTDPLDANTFTMLTSVTVASTLPEELIYAPSGLPSGTVTFALRSGVENKNFRVDNVRWEPIPSCPYPSDLSVSNLMSDSADLEWIENGSASAWDIEYGEDGFTPTGTPTLENVADNPYTLMGLEQGTAYQFYVRADCSGGDVSDWIGPFAFTTSCSYYGLPYNQDFTDYLPTCWSEGNDTDVATGSNGNNGGWGNGGFLNNVSNSSARFSFSGIGDMDWLVSPTFDLSTGSNGMAFKVGATGYSGADAVTMDSDDEVLLLISQDNGANWTVLQTWNAANTPSNTGDDIILDLSAFTSATTRLAFWANEGTVNEAGYNFYVDDVVVDDFATLSVEDNIHIENMLKYYPNPVNKTLTLKSKGSLESIAVYNLLGQQVLEVTPNMDNANIDFSNLDTGHYLVKVIVAGQTETIRIVKQFK